jgi:hypothetical protein
VRAASTSLAHLLCARAFRQESLLDLWTVIGSTTVSSGKGPFTWQSKNIDTSFVSTSANDDRRYKLTVVSTGASCIKSQDSNPFTFVPIVEQSKPYREGGPVNDSCLPPRQLCTSLMSMLSASPACRQPFLGQTRSNSCGRPRTSTPLRPWRSLSASTCCRGACMCVCVRARAEALILACFGSLQIRLAENVGRPHRRQDFPRRQSWRWKLLV